MKSKIIAGALAASLWGGLALADETTTTTTTTTKKQTPPEQTHQNPTEQQTQPTEQGTGGSGESSAETTPPAYVAPVVVENNEKVNYEDRETKKKNDMTGLTMLVGGGVEGYTGQLAPTIAPGAGYGVTAAIKPGRVVGIELGYTGAVNNLRNDAASGADIVRNGGQAALTVGLTATPVQPYLLGGVGINHYNVRGDAGTAGLKDDTNGYVPLGLGLRTHIGDFTADARGTYSAMFSDDFSNVDTHDILGVSVDRAGRFGAMVSLGATF